jgi:CRP-like cAMP-binding protein
VDQEAAMLARVPYFARLDPSRLKLLAFTSQALRFAPGDYIMREGEASDSTFLILEGAAEVVVEAIPGSRSEVLLGIIGPNAMIGEMGVLMHAPRTASVRAKDNVRALKIAAQLFMRLLSESPEDALDMMRQRCERQANSTRQIARLVQELADARAGQARALGHAPPF